MRDLGDGYSSGSGSGSGGAVRDLGGSSSSSGGGSGTNEDTVVMTPISPTTPTTPTPTTPPTARWFSYNDHQVNSISENEVKVGVV